MLPFSFSVNGFAVVAASVAFQALGAVYFMALVPKPYGVALGRTDLAGRKPEAVFIVGPLVCIVAVTLTNALLMGALRVQTLPDALVFGGVTGVGYLVATVFNVAINPNIPRPFLYGVVNAPFFLIGNLVNCVILRAFH